MRCYKKKKKLALYLQNSEGKQDRKKKKKNLTAKLALKCEKHVNKYLNF